MDAAFFGQSGLTDFANEASGAKFGSVEYHQMSL
jgi:hypothetical protein